MNDHRIFSGHLMTCPAVPGVTFVWPTHPEDNGFPQNKRGFSIPFVIVTSLVTSDELVAAAEFVGRALSSTASLRRAAKAWLRSDEAQMWPARRDGESRDEAVARVRQAGAEAAERRREKAEQERASQMTDEERAWIDTKIEIMDRHMALAFEEVDALRAARGVETNA